MKSVAQLDPQTAAVLAQWLKDAQITCKTKVATDEAGLEVADILVADEDFERACDAAEKWDAAMQAEREKKSARTCEQCGSKKLEVIPHESLDQVLRCKDCGTMMPM
jgi:Zn finger protein HypA/HybF involved in hydrogenase expression